METEQQQLLQKLIESVQKDVALSSSILLEDSVDGNSIPASHLTKIRKWTQKDISPESIHTYPVLMIDTAPTRNMVVYSAESQKKSVKKWVGTTFLFNYHAQGAGLFSSGQDHTLQAASQMGRIYDAKLVKTPKGETGTLSWFYTVSGIDDHVDSFISKLDAGILREVSIHISAPEGVICSICNDAFSKCFDNAGMDHYPGEKYGKQVCYMSTGSGGLIPLELSAVACPGSVNAHVMPDSEVEDYQLVSLREALGGSDEAIQKINRENQMRTQEQVAEARKKLLEAASAAGVTIQEFVSDEKNKEITETADVTAESFETVFAEEIEAEKKKKKSDNDGDETDKETDPPEPDSSKKQSLIGDDETCVVCGREAHPQTAETQQVETVKVQFRTQLEAVIKKSDEAIEAANLRVADADLRAKERDQVFADYVEEVVTLAIKFGVKPSSEKEAYRETLAGLPYQAVKEIRETLRVREVTEVKAGEKSRLEQSATDRAKAQLGETRTQTDTQGRTTTRTRRPTFGAK